MGALPKPSAAAEALGASVCAFVNTLAHAGVRHVCACPGSRSAPLLLALHAQSRIQLWMHLDERSAAYFALGLAKTLREPVAVLATSGTAAANFFPAVVEAFYARVPLVVLTADRPHELRDCGAPQTIDQLHLYGRHAKWFVDLPEPVPDASLQLMQHVRTIAARAVATATEEPAGPVHVNWPFREPLVPACLELHDGRQQARIELGKRALPDALLEDLAAQLAGAERGLIVCGPQDDPRLASSVSRLASQLGFPILADPLSGVRFGHHDRSLVVDAYDAFLRLPWLPERLEPDLVLRMGALPISKPLVQYLQRYRDAYHLVLDTGGWRDPTGLAGDTLHAEPTLTCAALADRLLPRPASHWTNDWLSAQHATRVAIADSVEDQAELFEGKVLPELASALPEHATVYVGNSMPVRDLDTFLASADRDWRVLANRGTNGIDGVVSSALGASAAGCGPTVLVIGDLSFYHDLNGLLAVRQHALDLLVVLLNNDGGGIFSFLPQAGVDGFERLFGTPHGLDFRPFVEGYGGSFVRAKDWRTFRDALAAALDCHGLRVVEVPTERKRNVVLHRELWQHVDRAVQNALAAAVVAAIG
jgi:2-succinyl-5-enolpyruvyl-6-hydroxy-3-cyclohexene-1-carboxylate synthase